MRGVVGGIPLARDEARSLSRPSPYSGRSSSSRANAAMSPVILRLVGDGAETLRSCGPILPRGLGLPPDRPHAARRAEANSSGTQGTWTPARSCRGPPADPVVQPRHAVSPSAWQCGVPYTGLSGTLADCRRTGTGEPSDRQLHTGYTPGSPKVEEGQELDATDEISHPLS